MQSFPVLTIDTAPAKSKPALQALQGAFGIIPNVAATMATSPVLIDSLVGLFGKVHGGNFTKVQIQTLLLTNAVTNGSSWRSHSTRVWRSRRALTKQRSRPFANAAFRRTLRPPRYRYSREP
jgi:phage tail tape-measure protein